MTSFGLILNNLPDILTNFSALVAVEPGAVALFSLMSLIDYDGYKFYFSET